MFLLRDARKDLLWLISIYNLWVICWSVFQHIARVDGKYYFFLDIFLFSSPIIDESDVKDWIISWFGWISYVTLFEFKLIMIIWVPTKKHPIEITSIRKWYSPHTQQQHRIYNNTSRIAIWSNLKFDFNSIPIQWAASRSTRQWEPFTENFLKHLSLTFFLVLPPDWLIAENVM